MADGMLRSPTFLVGAEKQKKNLEDFQRREQQLAEAYHKNKPLCFNATSYQKTHPVKAQKGHKDADACLTAPLVLGVADGVSQIEEFGIDASLLPNELLKVVEQLGMHQLVPHSKLPTGDHYQGPVAMLRRAFQATESLGSLTVVLAIMDNSTKIHGKLHPMIAVITIGDCELLILRRASARAPLALACHTEMQRIDGHAQTPLQLARVDDRIDPDFHEDLTLEVIERGSAVHCVTAYEGDIVLMGSDGVFDNLFLDEIVDLANNMLPPQSGRLPTSSLKALAQRVVELCHAKTRPMPNGVLPDAPIGRGGKKDDTSCVVGEIVEWTDDMEKLWAPKDVTWPSWLANFGFRGSLLGLERCCVASYESDEEEEPARGKLMDLKPTQDMSCVPTPMGGFPMAMREEMKGPGMAMPGMKPNMSGMQPGLSGMQPNGMQPNGMQPNGMQPNGMQPNGMQPNGMQPNSMQPNGMQPNGMQPNGMQPNGMQPSGMQPNMHPNAMSQPIAGMGHEPDQMQLMNDMQLHSMQYQRPLTAPMTWPPFQGQMYNNMSPVAPLSFAYPPTYGY